MIGFVFGQQLFYIAKFIKSSK